MKCLIEKKSQPQVKHPLVQLRLEKFKTWLLCVFIVWQGGTCPSFVLMQPINSQDLPLFVFQSIIRQGAIIEDIFTNLHIDMCNQVTHTNLLTFHTTLSIYYTTRIIWSSHWQMTNLEGGNDAYHQLNVIVLCSI